MIRVVTDGSCVGGVKGVRGAGGWCAIVEDGSEGQVLRGHVKKTTSTRMELVAIIEGLDALSPGSTVDLFCDCTVLFSVIERMKAGRPFTGGDAVFQGSVADQLSRLDVTPHLLVRRERTLGLTAQQDDEVKRIHMRAHIISRCEAKRIKVPSRALRPTVPVA